MRLKIKILFLTQLLFFQLAAQDEMKITWDYSHQSFSEFVSKAEDLYNLKFFYKEVWINDLKPGIVPGPVTLKELLDNLFKGKSLYYFIDKNGNVIITRNFQVRQEAQGSVVDTNYLAPTEYLDTQDKQKMTGNLFVDIGNPADKYKPGNVTISGYVTNRDTHEPVAGVTIHVQKLSAGTLSNEYGFYSLTLPRGAHLLQFSFIGMKEKLVNINLYGGGELNMEMNSTLIPLKETVVSAQKNVIYQRYEVGVEKISLSSVRLLPTSMGESDIVKSFLMIPGVKTVGEGSAGFNVRGGSSDQNLVLLYGAPLYNPSHFFGFFSSVNSDIIKDATLYKGGIPGRYGGRISSVLDISAREGNRNEFDGNAGISPITTHLMLEGPIKKDTCTYIITGRTTYSNWVLQLIDNASIKKSRASFYDLNAKLTYDLDKNNKIDLSGYISHDGFKFNSDTVYKYENSIVALRWRHFFNSRFFSVLSVNNSSYKYDVSSESSPIDAFILSHRINSTGLKADFNLYQGRNEINYGLDLTRHSVMPGSYKPLNDSSLVISRIIQKEKGMEGGIYAEDKFKVTDYFSVNGGIRFSGFMAAGPASIPVYDPDYPRSRSTVTDTISYGSGFYKAYAGPEYRLSLNFRISFNSSLKLNYNRTRQYLHMLSNTTTISPTDTWKLSDYYLKPQIGDQYAIGFYQGFFKNTIQASAEVYYKAIKNMVDFKGGTNLIMNEDIEKDLINVRGMAYGMELSVRKDEGRVRWAVSYTYARTMIRSTGNFRDETINNGEWFPANYDKPNELVTTFSFIYSRRISLSANYTWSTGRPITYPVSTYFLNNMLLIQYSERNKYRIPDYSRMDLSIRLNGNLRSHKIANPHWIFSVYNLLGRQNVYSIYFKNEKNIIYGYKLSVFGKAIPSISFNFDF